MKLSVWGYKETRLVHGTRSEELSLGGWDRIGWIRIEEEG